MFKMKNNDGEIVNTSFKITNKKGVEEDCCIVEKIIRRFDEERKKVRRNLKIPSKEKSKHFIIQYWYSRECVRAGAAGAQTRR